MTEENKYKAISQKTYRIRLTEKLLGSVPKNKNLFEDFIASKNPASVAPDNEAQAVQDLDEKGSTGFYSDDTGLFLFDYQFKGFIKHAGSVLRESTGIKNLKAKIDDYVFVEPRKIYLGKTAPDGNFERPLRAQTMQGERVCLARSDYIEPGIVLDITITLLPHKELSWDLIDRIMQHGKFMGIGQFRNGGFGRFEVIK